MMKFLLILKVELGFVGVELDFGCLLFLVFDDFIFKSVCFVGVELGFIGIGFVGVFLLMEIL